MISIIVYIIHFYILPRKIYSGPNCLEDWARGVRAWDATFNAANWIDFIILVAVCIITLWKLFENKNSNDASSKTED